MSTISAQLREQVLDNPRDTGVRAVFADALIQEGDPRGTFITLQQHLEGRLSPDKREAAKNQADALLRDHEKEWFALAKGWAEYRVRGGFIRALRSQAAKFVLNGPKLLAKEPVYDVTLTNVHDDDVKALAKMPELARIAEISLFGRCSDATAAALACSPHAARLSSINFNGGSPGLNFAREAANLKELETLVLTGSEFGDNALTLLAAHDLPRLSQLYLARCALSDESMNPLANGPALAHVVKLCLGGNEEITDDGADEIANGESLANLQHLELNQTGVGDDGASAIVKSKSLKALRRVDFRQTEVGATTIKRLRRPGLTVLGANW